MVDRQFVYTGAIPQDTDLLNTNKNLLYGLGYLIQTTLGTITCATGLVAAQTSTPSLQITIGPGAIYAQETVDATAYGDLGTDANTVMKQGLLKAAQTLTLTAPTTSGYSQVYLVEAAYQDVDGGATVLPYYNSADPSAPYSGPANAGTSNYTVRQGSCIITLKAGTAAPTGSQTTPSTDSGYIPLYTITLANGQTAITTAQIITATGAPFVPYNLNNIPTYFVQKAPATTFYVNGSTGNDSNPGTAALPFLTAQGAINYISLFYSSGTVTVNFAAGTYAGFTVPKSLISSWFFAGSSVGTCAISALSLAVNTGYGVESFATIAITGFTISAYNAGVLSNSGGNITPYGCNFVGIGASSIAFSALNGGVSNVFGASPGPATYTISGTFASVFSALSAGQIYVGTYNGSAYAVAITFGTTTVSGAVALAAQGAAVIFAYGYVSWAGSTPTGQRYFAALAAGITATGGGASFIPGIVAGSASSATYGYYQG